MDRAELEKFAKSYAAAWCSLQPESVAAFYAAEGALRVNTAPPAVGRAAIAEVAQGFMRDFPDMRVTMDKVVRDAHGTEFHWTLTGTNTGPNGRGKRVRISGYEEWHLDAQGFIGKSHGHFDSAEYARQLEHGADEP
jgi:predicted ester cyclase